MDLHEQKGVAQTTVSEIARRAGVTRLTVYKHFADLSELLPACSAHYMAQHPLPDFDKGLALTDDRARIQTTLEQLYGWYRETEPMFGRLFAERASVPELDEFMAQDVDRTQADLAERLAASFDARGRQGQRLHALARLALDFWTWSRLSNEGLNDAAAAGMMADALLATAR